MPRDLYYQSVGNPIQVDRLPTSRPDLQMPYEPYTSVEDSRLAVKLLFRYGLLTVAALITQMMHLNSAAAPQAKPFVMTNVVLIAIGLFLVVKAVKERRVFWLQYPLALLAAAFLVFNIPIPLPVLLLSLGLALGLFTWLLGCHWTAYCTASPMDRQTATRLRSTWQGYLGLMAILPPALLLAVQVAPLPLVASAVVAIVAIQLVIFAKGGQARFQSAWRALVSWLTYNRNDAVTPGILSSPAGRWPDRLAVTGLCVVLASAAYVRWPVQTKVVLSSEDSGPVSLASVVAWLYPVSNIRPPAEATYDHLALGLCSIVLTLLVPLALAIACPLILTLPVLAEAESYRKSKVDAVNWEQLTTEIQQSLDPHERDSIYMGRVNHDGSPLLVPRVVFHEHAHFLGDSGGGKTSLGLAPLLEQLISTGDCSVIVIDLKADSMELYATLEAAAVRARKRSNRPIPIKHFSNQVGRGSFAMNPLLQPYWRSLDLYMRTDIQCGALGLTYGADYGEGYYSSANAAVLYHTIKTFPDVVTFRELADRVGMVIKNAKERELHPEIRKAGVHVQTVLARLGSFEALNVVPNAGYSQEVLDQIIDFSQVFAEPQLQYYHLSSTLAPGSSPEIARLVTYSLLAAATQVQRRHQVYLVIDEFQRMVARNIEYMLQLARSMGVGIILANQTMQDLRTSTADLIPAIEANCRYRQWFSVSSAEDRRRLMEASGETVELDVSRTYGSGPHGATESVTYQERVTNRLGVVDILLASDHPKQSIVRISRGAGHAQYGGMPFIVESDYHISEDEYKARKGRDWPDGMPGTFVPGAPRSPSTPPPVSSPVVTVENINTSAGPAAQVADLFNSFTQSTPQPHPTRRRSRKGP